MMLLLAAPAFASNMAEEVLGGDIKVREDYAIVVEGETVTPDVPPVERGGVIFIPLRFAAEALHANITWYKKDKTAEMTFPSGAAVKMTIGNPEIDLGDTQKILPVAPFIFEKRTFIPLRATAESGWFRVEEKKDAMIIMRDEEKIKSFNAPGENVEVSGTRSKNPLAPIIEKARKDPITKKLKPAVLIAWALVGLLWVLRTAKGLLKGKQDGWKDILVIGFFLSAGMLIAINFMLSTYWVGIVILITSAIGLISTETYTDKLVTMASTAQGGGLICTLFGLGLLIGPAIADSDIAAIGYGIYVKIEPTITGLTLSIILNMLYGYEARKQQS